MCLPNVTDGVDQQKFLEQLQIVLDLTNVNVNMATKNFLKTKSPSSNNLKY